MGLPQPVIRLLRLRREQIQLEHRAGMVVTVDRVVFEEVRNGLDGGDIVQMDELEDVGLGPSNSKSEPSCSIQISMLLLRML